MGIVTTEQAIKAKARHIAEKFFSAGHAPGMAGSKAALTKLIEDAFLVDDPADDV